MVSSFSYSNFYYALHDAICPTETLEPMQVSRNLDVAILRVLSSFASMFLKIYFSIGGSSCGLCEGCT